MKIVKAYLLFLRPNLQLRSCHSRQEHLAELAIASVMSAEFERDGITYLIDAKRNGIVTPLSAAYEKELLQRTESVDWHEALRKLRG